MSSTTTITIPPHLLASCDAAAIVTLCEQAEQQSHTHPYVREHLLALLLLHDLSEAKYVWLRLSGVARDKSTAVWRAVQALLNGDNGRVFYDAMKDIDLSDAVQSDRLRPLMDKIVKRHRLRMVRLMSSVYDTVSVEKAKDLLGLDGEDNGVLQEEYCEKYGWTIQDTQQFIQLSNSNSSSSSTNYQPTSSSSVTNRGVLELQQLTEQLVKIQTGLN